MCRQTTLQLNVTRVEVLCWTLPITVSLRLKNVNYWNQSWASFGNLHRPLTPHLFRIFSSPPSLCPPYRLFPPPSLLSKLSRSLALPLSYSPALAVALALALACFRFPLPRMNFLKNSIHRCIRVTLLELYLVFQILIPIGLFSLTNNLNPASKFVLV